MTARSKLSAAASLTGLFAGASLAAKPSDLRVEEAPALRTNQAMVLLDYQVVHVNG